MAAVSFAYFLGISLRTGKLTGNFGIQPSFVSKLFIIVILLHPLLVYYKSMVDLRLS
jgi:hypothetical protein